MNKKLIAMLSTLSLCVSMSACSKQTDSTSESSKNATNASTTSQTTAADSNENANILLKKSTEEVEEVGDVDTYITLKDDNTTVDGDGVKVEKNIVTINQAGTYSISGTLNDGQIIVNTDKEEKTYIILDGVDITSKTSAPIQVTSSEKTVFMLAENSKNTVSDTENHDTEDEADATIYSKEDITFMGTGSLEVNGNYDKGIVCKDDIMIESGSITVKSTSDGIKGKDSVVVRGGKLTIESGKDGIQAYNSEEDDKGYISLEGGTIKITAEQDGVQAETNLLVAGGTIDIETGGGSKNSTKKGGMNQGKPGQPGLQDTSTTTEDDTTSIKALKAGSIIEIDDGTVNINSSEDAVHSNDKLIVNEGTLEIASGDDALHSDNELEINGGKTNITKSYEGIESAKITINSGETYVVASDDGLNAAGGEVDNSSTDNRQGPNRMESTTSGTTTINGGYLVVYADGDGLDANGDMEMNGGTVIVNGPTNGGNGALDYDGEFKVNGGTLIAAGSLGMVQTPSSSSKVNTINVSINSQDAGTLVNIQTEDGEDVITFKPTKTYSSVVICSKNIKKDETYKVYVGGSSTGTEKDGLYTDGEYTKGTEIGSSKISDTVTNITEDGVSANSKQPGAGGGGGRGKGQMMPPPSN